MFKTFVMARYNELHGQPCSQLSDINKKPADVIRYTVVFIVRMLYNDMYSLRGLVQSWTDGKIFIVIIVLYFNLAYSLYAMRSVMAH